ncbi:MAG: MBL fold metallo-hydrolase [Clostridia bacterium]|nr:MBL fold metallo-hydrolase [Clostridia bacterium]
MKWILLIVLGVVLLAAVIVLIYLLPVLLMTPAESGEILNTGIIALRNNRNCLYFIETSDGFILIDAGSNANAIQNDLSDMGIDGSKVKHILLTHSDSDHTAAIPLFPNAQIYLGKDELQMVDGTKRRSAFGFNALPGGVRLPDLTPLEDGCVLRLGGQTVECLKAPGHTPGSMLYLLDGKYLFTGDAFKVRNGVIEEHPFTMDHETADASVQKLQEAVSGSQIVITSHYGFFKPEAIKQ